MARKNLPVVSIVGRPNVGKSSLFNRLLKKRIAIVDEREGVTRDRKYEELDWGGVSFLITDTGGLVPDSDDIFQELIERQVEIAVDEAELIIFLLDKTTGITDVDEHIAKKLLREFPNKNIQVVINKVDQNQDVHDIYEFYSLGMGDPHPISSLHGRGIGDLLDIIIDKLGEIENKDFYEDMLNLAIVGKQNVGKSSLLNKIIGNDQVIVSNVPGTTRDPIDTIVSYEGEKFRFVDTAGIKKKSKIRDSLDFYSIVRTKRVIELSDVIIFVLDTTRPIDKQDEEVVNIIAKSGKPLIALYNKWDIVKNKETMTVKQYEALFAHKFSNLRYVPAITVSAKTGLRVNNIFSLVGKVLVNYKKMIDRDEIFQYFRYLISKHYHKPMNNQAVRFSAFYQESTEPPTFVLHTNQPKSLMEDYKRYIVNKIREKYDFIGTPIKLVVKKSKNNKDDIVETIL